MRLAKFNGCGCISKYQNFSNFIPWFLFPEYSRSYLKPQIVTESEDYFVYSVLPLWEAWLTMELHFVFRMSFQQEAFCSCMHDRRGMRPDIMIFLPKKEFWLRDFFGKSFVVFSPMTHVVKLAFFFINTVQPSHPLDLSLLVFSCFCSLSVRGNMTLSFGPEKSSRS